MTAMNQARVQAAVEMILDIEHRRFGHKIGLFDKGVTDLSLDQLVELIYAIDEFGIAQCDADARLAVQIVALVWEHCSTDQRDHIRGLCVGVLSRIGVSPSASMLENEPKKKSELLSPLYSLSGEMASAIHQVDHSEVIGGQEYYLTEFQSRVLDAVSTRQVIGVSAPTSAGKSFALYLCIVRLALSSPAPMIYIVPTISLMNQVSRDLRSLMDAHELHDWQVLTTFDGEYKRRVFVMTQERALPQHIQGVDGNFSLMVIDEVQNLERFSEDQDLRAKILLDSITELYEKSAESKVVLSGPRVSKLRELGETLFGICAEEVETSQAPVASLTYAISKDKRGVLLTQYSEFNRAGRPLRAAQGVVVPGFGGAIYSDEYIDYMSTVLARLGHGSKPIIFSPTADQARKTAVGLTRALPALKESSGSQRSLLAKYIAESIHPKYDLVRCVKAGIGFHTGRVPAHIRYVCEMAYSEGELSTMVCTTTLMQGVNLPANIVIARNPNLFIRKRGGGDPKLSPYEFSNLRGRAGRLMKDFVGRTLVMDGDSFDEDNSGDLFPDPNKDVKPSYRDLFEKNKAAVVESLVNPKLGDEASRFICSQIRYAFVRFGSSATGRLESKGIDLPKNIIADVQRQLSRLDVGRDVCLANRYWDPLDLQEIKDNFNSAGINELPDSPWLIDSDDLERILEFQARVSPYYFERYLGARQEGRLRTLSISAIDWAREKPLQDMLRSVYSPGNEAAAIESRVSDIQKYVIYGIPALLKPIADINGSGAGLLAAIESGVYTQVARMLVAKGLYRDTAVKVRRKLLPKLDGDISLVEKIGMETIDRQIHHLDYWVRRQVEPVLNQWKGVFNHGKGDKGCSW